MKIQTAIITVAIVLMVILSTMTISTFSFAVTRNSSSSSTGTQRTAIQSSPSCNPTTLKSLWDHTYGAGLLVHGQTSRLKELTPACVVFDGHVSGTPILDKDSRGQSDGDLHILLTPDAARDSALMNPANGGKMTAEIICWGNPTKSYTDEWRNYCDGVNPRAHIPTDLKQGDHVRVTGKWVQDIGYPTATHAKWNEIHPVESIEKLP